MQGTGVIRLSKGSALVVPEATVVGTEDADNGPVFTWGTGSASIEISAGTSRFTIKGGEVILAEAYKVYRTDTLVVDAGATLTLNAALTGEIIDEAASTVEIAGTVTLGEDGEFDDIEEGNPVPAGTYTWSDDEKWVKDGA